MTYKSVNHYQCGHHSTRYLASKGLAGDRQLDFPCSNCCRKAKEKNGAMPSIKSKSIHRITICSAAQGLGLTIELFFDRRPNKDQLVAALSEHMKRAWIENDVLDGDDMDRFKKAMLRTIEHGHCDYREITVYLNKQAGGPYGIR